MANRAETACCRELTLNSFNMLALGALFNIGATPRPSGLGVKDYGDGIKVRWLRLAPLACVFVDDAQVPQSDPCHLWGQHCTLHLPQAQPHGFHTLAVACAQRAAAGFRATARAHPTARACTYSRTQRAQSAAPARMSHRCAPHSCPRECRVAVQALALCPRTPNCISTAEAANDDDHYVPPWQYNPEDGRGMRTPASREQAMAELTEVVKTTKPDKFTPTIIKQTDDFLYVEYQSPTFGFIDDVEFYFPTDRCAASFPCLLTMCCSPLHAAIAARSCLRVDGLGHAIAFCGSSKYQSMLLLCLRRERAARRPCGCTHAAKDALRQRRARNRNERRARARCREGSVEYRSASRIGESDGDINRKRIRAIRQALKSKGWRSSGF